MSLYSKRYCDTEKSLKDNFLFTKESLQTLKDYTSAYKNFYCYEADIIEDISRNKEGYFDFSKGMIDIGAAIGEYAANLNFNKIYAFEPDKKLLWTCHANLVNADKEDKVETFQVALSDKEGEDTIFVNGINEFRKVPVKTLDSFNLKDIGFIKIDVEGFEEKVIRGGLLTIISNNYPPILFECWKAGQIAQDGTVFTQEKRDSLFNLLRTLGYEILECWGNIDTHLAVHK